MTSVNNQEKCYICLENYKIMVPLETCMSGCTGCTELSVAQVLNNLKFVTISDAEVHCRYVCFMCVAKIQSCFEFKSLCNYVGNYFKIENNYENFNSPTTSNFLPSNNIKQENNWDNEIETTCEENLSELVTENHADRMDMESKEAENPLNNVESTTEFTNVTNYCDNIEDTEYKIEFDEGIFGTKEEKNFTKRKYLPEQSSSNSQEKPYVCNVCNQSFSQTSHLATHKMIHSDQKPYVCNVCEESFNDYKSLRKHRMIHSNSDPLVCNICNRSFTRLKYFNAHQLLHTGYKRHVCDVCHKAFIHASVLATHKIIHSDERPFVCGLCPRTFKFSSNLMVHKLTHSSAKPHTCSVCKKSYKGLSSLRRHEQGHTDKFLCAVCNKSFTSRSDLKRHKVIHMVMH